MYSELYFRNSSYFIIWISRVNTNWQNMTTTFSNPSQLLPLGLCDILLLARHLGSHTLFCGLQCTFLSYVFSLTGVNKLMHVYNYVMDNHKSENINILNIPTRYHSSIKCTKAYTLLTLGFNLSSYCSLLKLRWYCMHGICDT